MSTIVLGKSGLKPITLDLDRLIRTRLLVQANSGGGKSYLLRRLAEQLFGKIPVLLIDPEGEFATLRERFGYVLVGKGGETPADPRSAALVAHRLLELQASAVCDLYEMPVRERHRWIRLFLEALIDAPKRLWRPTIIVVDEAHGFAPEKGHGESEASDAMIGLATRGRKRGFACVFATQRLGKLRKDVAAELLNVLIGQTFVDIDRKRAAEALGIPAKEERAFFDQVKVMEPGSFWGLGRALAMERVLIHIGPVQTTHPEPGSARHSAAPPPAPDRVRALLPRLQDLPKEAEERAQTLSDLRQEILRLRAEVRQAKQAVPQTKTETKEISVIKPADLARLERHIAWFDKIRDRLAQAQQVLTTEFGILADAVKKVSQAPIAVSPSRPFGELPVPSAVARPVHVAAADDSGPLDHGQRRILETVRMLNIRQVPVTREAVARWMGIHPNGGRYNHGLAKLRELGYLNGWRILKPMTGSDPSETGPVAVLGSFKEHSQRKVFAAILESKEPLTREELAKKLGIHPNGGRFNKTLAWFRDMGIIPDRGPITPTEGVFR